MKYRPRVTGLLILLFAITYIDRVCISVAGPRMQEDLGIDPIGWGWVTAMFTLSYCLFEIPTGALGDRIGPRRVLTRVVLWWSAFTSLTGAVSNYYLLLITRFCFGAGEAGAFPNASIVVSRWFPASQRASMSGVLLMASQIGGAIAPLLVVPIQIRYGWRASFFVFGAVGVVWAAVWYAWFRDSPAEKPGVSPAELDETRDARRRRTGTVSPGASRFVPRPSWRCWRRRSATSTSTPSSRRGFTRSWSRDAVSREGSLLLSALPYAVAACANLAGGAASDALVRRLGPKWGRRSIGIAGLGMRVPVHRRRDVHDASAAHHRPALARLRRDHLSTVGRLRRVPGHRAEARGIDGRADEHVGAGGRLCLVRRLRLHRRTLPAATTRRSSRWRSLLFVGALLWLKIDASKELSPEPFAVPVPATAL